jgi:hypothetical protein
MRRGNNHPAIGRTGNAGRPILALGNRDNRRSSRSQPIALEIAINGFCRSGTSPNVELAERLHAWDLWRMIYRSSTFLDAA